MTSSLFPYVHAGFSLHPKELTKIKIDAETFSQFTAGYLTVNFIIGVLSAEQRYSVIWSAETNSPKCKQNTNRAKLWIVSWAAYSV